MGFFPFLQIKQKQQVLVKFIILLNFDDFFHHLGHFCQSILFGNILHYVQFQIDSECELLLLQITNDTTTWNIILQCIAGRTISGIIQG